MSWVNGRQLASTSDGTNTYSYIYDAAGSRIMKNVGTVNHLYFYVNGMLLMEYRYNAMGDTTDVLQYFYDANGKPHAMAYNGTVYLYVTNLQGDIVALLGMDGTVSGYEYDPYGNVIASYGDIAAINPLRYRGYYYDNETGLYYLQSRYYDPVVGRFINADEYVSTGQGLIGCNMFAYCNNSPIAYSDSAGQRMVCVSDFVGGGTFDYVIFYSHPESTSNLEEPAKRNHSDADSYFTAVGSFEELVTAVNNTPGFVDDVFLYLHGDANDLSFYYDLNYSAEDIKNSFAEITIYGEIYLFSCKGGRGALASTMASTTNCTVIASEYKVSFDMGSARCGWWDYYFHSNMYGNYTWYSFSTDGNKSPYSMYSIYTQ